MCLFISGSNRYTVFALRCAAADDEDDWFRYEKNCQKPNNSNNVHCTLKLCQTHIYNTQTPNGSLKMNLISILFVLIDGSFLNTFMRIKSIAIMNRIVREREEWRNISTWRKEQLFVECLLLPEILCICTEKKRWNFVATIWIKIITIIGTFDASIVDFRSVF